MVTVDLTSGKNGPHAASHKKNGSDEIKVDELGSPSDNTNLNVDTNAHGFAPKAPNDPNQFLNGLGGWSTPAGTGGAVALHAPTHSAGSTDPVTLSNLAGAIADAQISPSTLTTSNTKTVTAKTINPISNPIPHLGQFKYMIFKDGSTWYCRNNITGNVDSSDTDPTTVLQYAITNVAGYGIKIFADTILTTSVINCVDKYLMIEGEGSSTAGSAGVTGATIIKANFVGTSGNAVFNCLNSGYTKQYFRKIIIDCNNNVDYGIDAFGVRECENYIDDVAIINYKKSAHRVNQCWMSSISNPNYIPGSSRVTGSIGLEMIRPSGAAVNTIRISKGRIANNDINISMDGANGNMIEGVALEGAYVSAVKTFNNANANSISNCSFEYAVLASIAIIDEGGNANVYENNRFDAFNTAYNIITVRSTCKNLAFAKNMIQANNAGTTATIIIEAGATNIDFIYNKQLTNTPVTVTITDGQPSETEWIGNSFVQNRLRTGIQLGSNGLWIKEIDANTVGLRDSGNTAYKNFIANGILTSVIRTTGSTDMITIASASAISFNSKNLTNLGPTGFVSYLDISSIAAPANPSTGIGRIYVRAIDANNDGVFVLIKKGGSFVESQIL